MEVALGPREFTIQVLGRTLEHLGYQMYKRRDAAIAELVANCWDAGSELVQITLPDPATYDRASSQITITDDGSGMAPDQVQNDYLVVGRNRRSDDGGFSVGRAVMGRKGIGKLAGFGIASQMKVETWREGRSTTFALDAAALKAEAGDVAKKVIPGQVEAVPKDRASVHGTQISLSGLKHRTPMDAAALIEGLGRRFTRTIRGQMTITVNGVPVEEPLVDFAERVPPDGVLEAKLNDGGTVAYSYGFSKSVLASPQMRGFTIQIRGKTAQAPPYFFGVEGTASGQHGTRYLTGAIEADYLDSGTDEESDLIATDRQEIDWEVEDVAALLTWGQELTRSALRAWANRREDEIERVVRDDTGLLARLERLDRPSREQALRLIRTLGRADADLGRAQELGGAILTAFEYRHFHDLIDDIERAGDDPDELKVMIEHILEWRVLESRAILEIVRGRLQIIEKFHSMIVENAPERAKVVGRENMHDLIAGYPWLLDPDWQVFAEEKSLTSTLREWGDRDIAGDTRMRYDFLALSNNAGRIIIIEIKRSGHVVDLGDVQRLQQYKHELSRARPDIDMVLVSGATYSVNMASDFPSIVPLTWAGVHERTKRYYEHYRAILEGDIESDDFDKKRREVAQTRAVLATGAYRTDLDRASGIGPQDFPTPIGLADASPGLSPARESTEEREPVETGPEAVPDASPSRPETTSEDAGG